jgi:hypothetical protein
MRAHPPVAAVAIAAASVLLAVVPARAAAAEDDGVDPVRGAGRRAFGVGPTAGVFSGFGAIAGGGGDTVKAWLSGGYFPVLVFANARTPDRAMRFNYYGAYQLGGDVTVRLFQRARTDFALLLGYKFNSVLGHGAGGGVRILHDLSDRVALEISAGLAVFPSAQDRLDREFGYPADRVPPLTPALQGGANLGLLVFP